MRPDVVLHDAGETSAADPEACRESPGSASSARDIAGQTEWVLSRDEESEALGLWRDVSRMWPRNWWSPTRQLEYHRLRRYARSMIRALKRHSKVVALVPLVFAAASSLLAEGIKNWQAPATWTPQRAHTGLTTMGDVTSPVPFIGANPCRIADTRNAQGPYGQPPLSQGSPRNFTLTGQCGIPAGAAAVSLNVTVTNTQGPGFILIYPAGGAQPTVSTLNYVAGQTIANAAVVPLGACCGANYGAIAVIAGVSGTDLILDMNGYYSEFINTNEALSIVGSAFSPYGLVYSQNSSTVGNSKGVFGREIATAGVVFGVVGDEESTATGAAGVWGVAGSTTGTVFGVEGSALSTDANASGVRGVDATGSPVTLPFFGFTVGVLGESTSNIGVWGRSRAKAVAGSLIDTSGNQIAFGVLGDSADTTNSNGGGTGPWGVFAGGDLGVTGVKHFVEPHPEDPNTVILYSSLEGREVGTYFRGTARTVKGEAVIEVPEDFRIVTDEEGLTVQLTPMGDLATLAVIRKGLDRIVVRSSKDVTFDYLVQGVRRAFKDLQPLARGYEFMPRSADERMPAYLTEEAKRRLIANGTYNPDGTVNMETAERVGWTRIWKEREERDAALAAANRAAGAAIVGEKR